MCNFKEIMHPRWLSGRAFASHAEVLSSISGCDGPRSLKQVMTAPLQSALQLVLGDDHYKRMTRVTVGLAR